MISKSFLIMLFTLFMSITSPANSDFFDLSFESIDGNIISLKEFKNKPIIVVNSASFCGFTYQYEQLENLYKKYINCVFVPNKSFQNSNNILDKLKNISKYSSIDWNEGHFYFYEDEIQTIHRNNVFLFGDAGFSFEPHLAQVGNNIIEDASYLKFLIENNNSYDEIFEKFSRNTCKKKRELKTISNIVGIFFGINTFTKLRDGLVSNFSNKLMYDFFKKVWYD